MISKMLTYYAVILGTIRALQKVREEIRSPCIVSNELRTLDIWFRNGSFYHEETP